MLGEENFAFVGQLFMDEILHPDPLPNPKRNGHQERSQPGRRIRQITVQNAIELKEGFLVEGDEIQFGDLQPRFLEAKFHGVPRKRRVVFLPGEPLLLRRRQDDSVAQYAGCAVMIECGDAKDVLGHGQF